MKKEQLLEELVNHTRVALRPSPIHGIGVYAIDDIPKGCRSLFSHEHGKWVKLSFTEVEKLPEHSKSLVETYCLYDEDHYYVPEQGFKVMDLVFYLNHSSSPNLISVNDGEYFETTREITTGEELLVNYKEITNVEEYD
jgi:SET domain-containing protein